MTRPRRVIFSGAPGAGKSTLLRALAARGYHVVEESARAIIRDRVGRGLSPRPAPRQFAADVMRRDIKNYHKELANPDWVFFDRAIPDGMCMLNRIAPLGRRKVEAIAKRFAYHRQVFMFPPWAAIYCNDTERDQTFSDATQVFTMLSAWYRKCGYAVVNMPLEKVDDRCDFVLKTLSPGSARV